MALTGDLFLGCTRVPTVDRFQAVDPATGQALEPRFAVAGTEHVDQACALAEAAAVPYRAAPLEDRAALLEAIAVNIEGLGDTLLERAAAESGLPLARLTGERARTCGQLRLFAAEVRDGGWMRVRIDQAIPDRTPLPRPDLRLRFVPLGPVAVFGASNFPLAFSVAGGDTAAALAAGCPVVVKAHPAHPGASELLAGAIAAAVRASGLPEGVFSMVGGPGNDVGGALVADPRIKAVGFTGSRAGGLALMRIAAARPVPIPVYAEMSAVNPVLLLPGALEEQAEALAAGYVGSLTMGAGQFCTNPGLVLAIDGPALRRFTDAAAAQVRAAAPAVMLTPGIHAAYDQGVERLAADARVTEVARADTSPGLNQGRPALFAIDGDQLAAEDPVTEEVFGASSVLVRCRDADALEAAVARLEGQLTATLHLTHADLPLAARLLPLLEDRAGRILANGWPTGVEVTHAMVHGGPFPATSDGRSTSVGTLAIERFLRPVCYQDLPDALLADALRNGATSASRDLNGRKGL